MSESPPSTPPIPASAGDGWLLVVSSLGASHRRTFYETVSAHYPIWLFVGGPGFFYNPLLRVEPIAGGALFNALIPGYLLPAFATLVHRGEEA